MTCSFLAKDGAEETQLVVERLTRAQDAELSTLMAEYGNRLLIHPARGMVILLGGCDGRSPQTVVFLPRAKVGQLERLGVRSLIDFLSDGTTPRQGGQAKG